MTGDRRLATGDRRQATAQRRLFEFGRKNVRKFVERVEDGRMRADTSTAARNSHFFRLTVEKLDISKENRSGKSPKSMTSDSK